MTTDKKKLLGDDEMKTKQITTNEKYQMKTNR